MSFWDWFIGDAGAAWIFGALGLLWGIFVWLRRGETPPIIIVHELERVKLLDIHPSQADHLTVLYRDETGKQEKIQYLEQKKIVIYNNGTRDVTEPIVLSLNFHSENSNDVGYKGLWRFIIEDQTVEWETLLGENPKVSLGLKINVPYLNSFSVHKQYVTAYLISEKSLSLSLIKTLGKGWSSRFISIEKTQEIKRSFSRFLSTTIGLSFIVSAIFVNFLFDATNLPLWVRIATLPLGIVILSIIAYVGRKILEKRIGGQLPHIIRDEP